MREARQIQRIRMQHSEDFEFPIYRTEPVLCLIIVVGVWRSNISGPRSGC